MALTPFVRPLRRQRAARSIAGTATKDFAVRTQLAIRATVADLRSLDVADPQLRAKRRDNPHTANYRL